MKPLMITHSHMSYCGVCIYKLHYGAQDGSIQDEGAGKNKIMGIIWKIIWWGVGIMLCGKEQGTRIQTWNEYKYM